ncbi:MAG TPA: reverse transcriptase domain-containing protein, partial [Chloroflexota bacterium]|nr:reverse transcriptase domain-containing protein [Chloroflexota bacterium]
MGDRAAQALAKAALEPEWEARFEPHSYGFRPGRSCHDAVEAIHTAINQKARYVLDADIAKCFDRIDHGALLRKLATYPRLRRAIKAWLGSGVMDGGRLFPTDEGTPQGGVISPLLANIALHGLETAIAAAFPKYIDGNARWRPITIRYADDFIVLHHDHAAIERAREIASHWLAGIGLELKPSKTRITHTLDPVDGNVGFDFLGFHVRQYRVGKTHTGTTRGKGREVVRLGFKTIITPSKEAVRRHHAALAEIIHRHRTAPQAALISALNPVIRGWTYYYSASAASETFKQLDHLTYWKLARWAKRRHRKKSGHWVTA